MKGYMFFFAGVICLLVLYGFCIYARSFFKRGSARKKQVLKGALSLCLIGACIASCSFAVFADDATDNDMNMNPVEDAVIDDTLASADFQLDAKSAVLMEASTGKVLYEMNPDEALPPASVTKIMTLLLIMEAIDDGTISLNDTVCISAYAASMGGSQVFLEEGENMGLEDLLKCTVIASANDAAVALAEHLMGSEEAFVNKMNARALEMGLKACKFENVTGLDDDTIDHCMSAADIAIISKELISHKKILEYSSVWMDTIRDGAFTLTNTNRLIRYYNGATGLKTGSTDKAKFCITATAERDGMTLIAVIMGAPSRDVRNACAKTLFDWGFANYALYSEDVSNGPDIPILKGEKDNLKTCCSAFSTVVEKGNINKIKKVISVPEQLEAPVAVGDEVGTVTYLLGDSVIGCAPIKAQERIDRLNYIGIVGRMFKIFILS